MSSMLHEIEQALPYVWNASWQAACLVLLVALTIGCFGKRLAPRWRFALWSLVFVRLALPVTPASPVSLFRNWWGSHGTAVVEVRPSSLPRPAKITERANPIAETSRIEVASQPDAVASAAPSQELPEPSRIVTRQPNVLVAKASEAPTPVASEPASHAPSWAWIELVAAVWAAGLCLLLLQRAFQHITFVRRSRNWSRVEDPQINSLLARCCRTAGVRTGISILVTDEATGPAVAGMFRRRLLIPATMLRDFTPDRLEMIFLHELAHIRRFDVLVQELLLILRATHWFNPFAWWTLSRMQLEREMACDEFVLSALGAESRQEYGRTLLEVLERGFGRSLIPGLLGTLDRLQQRVQSIRDYRPRSRVATAFALALVCAIGAVGLTNPSAPKAAEPIVVAAVEPQPEKAKPENIPAQPTGALAIDGRCVDEKNQPLADVQIQLLLFEDFAPQPLQKWEHKTSASGEFKFDKLVPIMKTPPRQKHYVLTAVKAGHVFTHRTFGVTGYVPTSNLALKMPSKSGALSGRVLDEHGKPLSGASVFLDSHEHVVPGYRQATTDADGRYSIEGMPLWKPDTIEYDPVTKMGSVCTGCAFRIKHPNYPLMMGMFSGIPQTVDVQLTPGIVVEGKVTDTVTGQPASSVIVVIQGINQPSYGKALTDSNGSYRIQMADDDYQISVTANDRIMLPIDLVTGPKGKAFRAPELKLASGGIITGRLIDKSTGQPFKRPAKGEGARITCVGPPLGKQPGSTQFAYVDDDGRFRIRAIPGLNRLIVDHPFDITRRFNGKPQPERPRSVDIQIRDGESVVVEFSSSIEAVTDREGTRDVQRFEARLVSKAGVSSPLKETSLAPMRLKRTRHDDGRPVVERKKTRVGKLLDRLEDEPAPSTDSWGQTIRDLVNVGPTAVPELIAELDDAKKPSMISSLAIVLRGIGDPHAIPALIRALPRTCLTEEMSDCGYEVKDVELAAFLRKLERSGADSNDKVLSFGRPVNEVCTSLQKLAGTSHGEDELRMISAAEGSSLRQQYLQHALFERCAERWEGWWQQNYKRLGVSQQYAFVNLPRTRTAPSVASPDEFPHGRGYQANVNVANLILQSVRDAQAKYVFIDFDTGREGKLPDHLKAAATNSERLDDILAWAAREGYDVMGTEYTLPGDKKSHYVLRALGMTTWEIDVNRWPKFSEELAGEGRIDMGTRTNGLLARYDAARGQYLPEQTAAFLFQTRDGTYGAMFVGVEVHDDNWKELPAGKSDELNPTGYAKGRRFAYTLVKKLPPQQPQRGIPNR